jgi:hypothetical protein
MCFEHIYRSRHVRLDSIEAGLLMTHPRSTHRAGDIFHEGGDEKRIRAFQI